MLASDRQLSQDLLEDFFNAGSQRLRAQLIARICAAGCSLEEANRLVRSMVEDHVVDYVTVCYYDQATKRVLMEPGLAPGRLFKSQIKERRQSASAGNA